MPKPSRPTLKREESREIQRGAERGSALEFGLYTLDGELYDQSEPWVEDLLYMIEVDSQAQALLYALTMPILGSKYSITEGPEDSGEAEFVRENLLQSQHRGGMATPMYDILAQMAEAQANKRTYFEVVWGLREDGSQVIEKLAWRPPRTCNVLVDMRGYVEGFRQRGMTREGKPFEEDFKGNKAFVYIHQQRRRPTEGVSAFQTAWHDFNEKLKITRLHNIHLQNFALGTIIGRYTGRARNGARKLFDKIKKYRGGGGGMVLNQSEAEGRGEEVEFISAVGAGTEFLDKLTYLNTQMAGSTLLRFLQLGTEGNTGAWALSRDHSDFFLMAQEAIQSDIASQLTNGPIAELIKVNFGQNASFPEFEFAPLSETQQKLATEMWGKLVASPNRINGPEWEALQEIALRFLGIDLDKVREEAEKAGEEEEELPGGGSAEDLLESLQQIIQPQQQGQGARQTVTKPAGGSAPTGGSGAKPNIRQNDLNPNGGS